MTDVRDWREADLDDLLAINEAGVPGVGMLTCAALDRMVRQAGVTTLVADVSGHPMGFALCMIEGLAYESLNYKWVSERYQRFAYVDRIAIAAAARGHGLGALLYQAVFERFSGCRDRLLAEVNLAPPNPGSLRFHQRLGFREIGERWEANGGKGVVYLERAL